MGGGETARIGGLFEETEDSEPNQDLPAEISRVKRTTLDSGDDEKGTKRGGIKQKKSL